MGEAHVGRGSVAAPPARVYRALVSAEALEQWLPPAGMTGTVNSLDARPGGGYRLVLRYVDASVPGKAGDGTDVVEVAFADLVADRRVAQRVVFESEDPAFAGLMTMTWELAPSAEGTLVTVRAEDVPPGIDRDVHETAIASSLAQLAAYVEGRALSR